MNEETEFVDKLHQLNIPTNGLGPKTLIEFNPNNENPKLVGQWLNYRGQPYRNLEDVVDLSLQELTRPGKPFSAFVDFDPKDASVEFMKAWLSNFGVGGSSNDKNWWVKKTKQMLHLLKSLSKRETLSQKFARLIDLRKKQKQKNRKMALLNLQLTRLIDLKSNIPLIDYNTNIDKKEWFVKQLLAKALDASAVAVPVFFYTINKRKTTQDESLASAIKQELPKIATKSFVVSAYSQDVANAVIRDIDNNSLFPFEITKQLAKTYLTTYPKVFQILTGIVVPSVRSVFGKTRN